MRSPLLALGTFGIPLLANAATPAAEVAPAVSTAGSLLQVFIGLVAVLLLIAAAAWAAKRLGVTQVGASNLMRVISSASVGTRERVVVVEIGESWLVVGVAPGSVNALMTLPKSDMLTPASAAPSASFAARLHHLLEKRRGQ